MDATGWGAVAGVAVVVAALGAWRLRRGTSASPAYRVDAAEATADAQGPSTAGGDAGGSAEAAGDAAAADALPTGRALTRELFAAAVEVAPAGSAAPQADEAAYAAITAACAHLLSRPQFQSRYLPRRPYLLPRLMRALNDPEAGLDHIAQIVGEDPTLSANLLRIANSPYYRVQRSPVESLPRAAALLGLDGMRPVLVAALLQPVLSSGSGPFRRLPAVIWEHTRMTADVAFWLVRGRRGTDEALVAQMAALLHGLGAIVVVQLLRENAHLAPDPATVARVLEEQAAPMAYRIAQAWELPARIEAALDAQRGEAMGDDPFAGALRAGRMAAALALLCRAGRWTPEQGLALLQAWADRRWVDGDIEAAWARLRADE
jgi:HD-like signal output (HDOD) protein